jgi:hypothetical protein
VASSPTKLMTFEEVARLPEPEGLFYFELHRGELVQLIRPALNHMFVQKRLQTLLESASAAGSAFVEGGLRMLDEYEYRKADLAWSRHPPAKAASTCTVRGNKSRSFSAVPPQSMGGAGVGG